MRITLVCPFDPWPQDVQDGTATVGGVERVFEQAALQLARRGHQVTLLCSTGGAGGTAMHQGVRVVRQARHGTFLRTPVADLATLLPRDSQVVHVPATYPFTTVPVLKRARRLGIPAVLDFHFEPVPDSTLGALGALAYRTFAPAHYSKARAVLVRSHGYADSAPSLGEVDRDLLRIVPNGIDPARFRPDGPRAAGDYLLFVGRLVPYKGLDVLIRALAAAKLRRPLVVVGDGPQRAQLEGFAKRKGVDVRWLGRVPDTQLPALYRGARLTVLPSVNRQEAFGICLIESMACGTPVVASRLPGVDEVASLGGLLAEPGDVASLAQRLRTALDYPALPRGALLAARIHRRFSWAAIAQRLESIYQEATAPPGRRRTAVPTLRPAAAPRLPAMPRPPPVAAHAFDQLPARPVAGLPRPAAMAPMVSAAPLPPVASHPAVVRPPRPPSLQRPGPVAAPQPPPRPVGPAVPVPPPPTVRAPPRAAPAPQEVSAVADPRRHTGL